MIKAKSTTKPKRVEGTETSEHLASVVLREGAALLKSKKLKGQNILIHVYNHPDALTKDYIHLLFINKKQFLDVVQNNLALFQYVLGSGVTAESLLDKLTDPDGTFHHTLKNDKVLIGILLGFGTQNALHVARIEDLQEHWFSESPPLSRRAAKFSHFPTEYKKIVFLNCLQRHDIDLQPSFGFSSIDDEMEKSIKKITCSSEKLEESRPHFIFGHLQDIFSKELIAQLEEAQQKIQQLLAEKTFLPHVLALTFPNEIITLPPSTTPQPLFNREEQNRLGLLVANSLWDMMEEENKEYVDFMIQGMRLADLDKTLSISHYGEYHRQQNLLKIRENLKMSENSLHSFKDDPGMVKVASLPVYYKISKQGAGRSLDRFSQALAYYSLTYPDGQIIVDIFAKSQPETLNLHEIIPGLALGMIGMQVGEEREIVIHPSLAYGIFTPLQKGMLIKAKVRLVNVMENASKASFDLSNIEVQDLHQELEELGILNEQKLLELSKRAGLTYGYQAWQHYKKSSFYSLEHIVDQINSLKNMETKPVTFSAQDLALMNRLHLILYSEPARYPL